MTTPLIDAFDLHLRKLGAEAVPADRARGIKRLEATGGETAKQRRGLVYETRSSLSSL